MSSELMWEVLVCCFYGTGAIVLIAVAIAFVVGAYKSIKSIEVNNVGDIKVTTSQETCEETAQEIMKILRREMRKRER